MATITSTQSGLWSATGTWVGGVVPVDGDEVILAAGHNVKMDADQSAFTGLVGVTIQGHATTPAMLYFMAGTSGYLKLTGTAQIVGTTGAEKGRILANSDGVWANTTVLPYTDKAIIELDTGYINGTYLDVNLRCFEPTTKFVRTYGTKTTVTVSGNVFSGATLGLTTEVCFQSSGALPAPLLENIYYRVVSPSGSTFKVAGYVGGPEITLTDAGSGTIEVLTGQATAATVQNVLEDVTGEDAWTETADHNAAASIDRDGDHETTTITDITATTITTEALNSAQAPCAILVMGSRNVAIRGAASFSGLNKNFTSGHFGCELSPIGSAGYVYGIQSSNDFTVTGIALGVYSAIHDCSDFVSEAIYAGCDSSINVSDGFTCSGDVFGGQYGIASSRLGEISGDIIGSGTAIQISSLILVTGNIRRSNYALYQCDDCEVAGEISNIDTILLTATERCVVTGKMIVNKGDIVNSVTPIVFIYGDIAQCKTLVSSGTASKNIYVRSCLLDVTDIIGGAPVAEGHTHVHIENEAGVLGADRILYDAGSVIRRECGEGAPVPTLDPDGGAESCLEVSGIESICSVRTPIPILQDFRLWVPSGSYTLRFKTINTFASGLASGDIILKICYLTTDRKYVRLVEDETAMSTATDWSQGIEVSFVQNVAGWVNVDLLLQAYEAGSPLLFVYPVPELTA